MKIIKMTLSIVLCVAVLATTGVAFYNNYTQNRAGRYTAATTISDTEREWILTRFGREYSSIEEYISTVQSYGSSDLIVKRRDSPFCPGILCFLQEESIRNKKVPKDKISGTVKTLITTTANRQYLILT